MFRHSWLSSDIDIATDIGQEPRTSECRTTAENVYNTGLWLVDNLYSDGHFPFQAGQGIPTGTPGHLLVKTESGLCHLRPVF